MAGQIFDGTHENLDPTFSEPILPRGPRRARCLAVRSIIYGVRTTEDFGADGQPRAPLYLVFPVHKLSRSFVHFKLGAHLLDL
jgi:hypothetical protein